MRKLFAIIATLVVSSFAFNAKAQLSDIEGMPPYKLGITVGMNNTWLSGSSSAGTDYYLGSNWQIETVKYPTLKYTASQGFQAGVNLMVDASPMIPNTFARLEIKYSMKGANWEDKESNITEKIRTHYIEIPVHYGYAWYINDDLTLMAETGPYFAFGLTGEDRMTSNKGISSPKVFGRLINGNRFDMGWGAQASVMIAKNYQVHVAYDYGFINLNDHFLQNRNLSVGFTWFFESLFD